MEFKSAITRGGNAIIPEIINVSDSDVTWKKRNKTLISSDSISIPIQAISSVEIDTSLVGTKIKIRSNGQGEILATNFTSSDAKAIKKLINQYQDVFLNKKNKKSYDYNDEKEETSNPELEIKQFEEEKYHDLERILLISFSNNANEIIVELNKFIALTKHSILMKETNKITAYQNKISEGLRLLDTLNLLPQQIQIKDAIAGDLHNLIIKSNLIQGLSISKNNKEKLNTIYFFILRYKWWALFILSFIYITIRNLFEK